MEVVRLSNKADRKKVIKVNAHNKCAFFVTLILSVIIVNPPCASINSTMAMAPKRKNMISEISPICSNNSLERNLYAAGASKSGKMVELPKINKVQHKTPNSSAVAVLLI